MEYVRWGRGGWGGECTLFLMVGVKHPIISCRVTVTVRVRVKVKVRAKVKVKVWARV